MDVLARIDVAGRPIDFGVASTRAEREAVIAQRFRAYLSRGYYRADLTTDRDEYDDAAVHVLARLGGRGTARAIVGSARFIVGEDRDGFRFPIQHAFELDLPEALTTLPRSQCGEITRVVSEGAGGIGLGTLLIPLGLIHAVSLCCQRHDIPTGLAMIKRRLFWALTAVGIHLRELGAARVIYPVDGPVSPYFYRHPDPIVSVYWLVAETAPTIENAIARYIERHTCLGESPRSDRETATIGTARESNPVTETPQRA